MARGNPDLDDYCRCSWYLCKKGDEIKKLLEEMKNATADVWYDKYQEYTRIMESMEDVMHRVEYMNEMFKELYKYNEDLYNRTMCGAYYEKATGL